MKKHGLWAWHHALNQSQRKFRWWDDEIEKARNVVAVRTLQSWTKPYSDTEKIKKCAARALTLLKLPMTVGSYVELCRTIGTRMQAHSRSIIASTNRFENYKPTASIVFNKEYGNLEPRLKSLSRPDVIDRKERLKQYKNSHCCMCNHEIYKPPTKNFFRGLWELGINIPWTDEKWAPDSYARLCKEHHKQMATLDTKAKKAENIRLEINRTKRIINKHRKENQNEST